MQLEPGIDFWASQGKFRVRISRNNTRYNVGMFDTLEDAKKAKYDFIEQFSLKSDDSEAVPMYSIEWFRRERYKQINKFSKNYGVKEPNKPTLVVAHDRFYSESTDYLKHKRDKENDNDIMFEPN